MKIRLSPLSFYSEMKTLIGKKNKLLVGFSGGMDSSVLMYLCSELSKNYSLLALYINHGLRNDTYKDEEFVKNKSKEYNIPLYIFRTKELALKNESAEMYARRIRYKAFENYRKLFLCDFILTAHHSNDSFETVLMHLNDGCSISGLKGIPKKNGAIIRPLLSFSKKSIKDYAKKNNIQYINDDSNKDISIKRNFIRHKIVTPWECQVPDIIEKFSNLSKKAIMAEKKMDGLVALLFKRVQIIKGMYKIEQCLLEKLTLNQTATLIKYLVGDRHISWRRNKWSSLKEWIKNSKTGSKYRFSDNWALLKNRKELLIQKNQLFNRSNNNTLNKIFFNDKNFVELIKRNKFITTFSNSKNIEIIDADSIKNKKLKLRVWRKGDRFQPLGMKNNKKISDFLIDRKVDLFTKEKQLVLTADGKIIWVCGHHISENVKISNNTKTFLELSFKKNKNKELFVT